jgi:hypothetical protein
MDASKYDKYTGVDISASAIQRASVRSEINRRKEKNEWVCSDISSYRPTMRYDVILFRESIFYIRKSQICGVLSRYRNYLKTTGVFIVRMCDTKRYISITRLIERHYRVVDRSSLDDAHIILVFK